MPSTGAVGASDRTTSPAASVSFRVIHPAGAAQRHQRQHARSNRFSRLFEENFP